LSVDLTIPSIGIWTVTLLLSISIAFFDEKPF
jgi:hypothetical protein